MKQILLFGSYGQSNIGDEEILRIFVKFFKEKKCQLFVNSSNSLKTEREFGVKSFSTSIFKDIYKKIQAFVVSDAYVFGGGSLLVEYRDVDMKWYQSKFRALMLALGITLIGKLLGKKIILASIGIGPLKSNIGKTFASIILSLSDLVIVRDKGSYEFAKNRIRNVILSADVVLTYPIQKTERLKQVIFFPNFYLPLSKEEKEKLSIEIVRYINLLHGAGYKIFVIPLWYDWGKNNDLWYANLLKGKGANLEIVKLREYSEIAQYLSKSSFCFTMKLHGAIFSALHQIPFIGLNHNLKMEEFVKELEPNFLMEISKFSADSIMEAQRRLTFSSVDLESLKRLRERSELTFKQITRIIK